jgi:hypothetical protein
MNPYAESVTQGLLVRFTRISDPIYRQAQLLKKDVSVQFIDMAIAVGVALAVSAAPEFILSVNVVVQPIHDSIVIEVGVDQARELAGTRFHERDVNSVLREKQVTGNEKASGVKNFYA